MLDREHTLGREYNSQNIIQRNWTVGILCIPCTATSINFCWANTDHNLRGWMRDISFPISLNFPWNPNFQCFRFTVISPCRLSPTPVTWKLQRAALVFLTSACLCNAIAQRSLSCSQVIQFSNVSWHEDAWRIWELITFGRYIGWSTHIWILCDLLKALAVEISSSLLIHFKSGDQQADSTDPTTSIAGFIFSRQSRHLPRSHFDITRELHNVNEM